MNRQTDNSMQATPSLSLAWLSDVRCHAAPVPERLTDMQTRGVLWQAAPARFLLSVPEVGRYLVEQGRHIAIDAEPGTQMGELERFLRMTPLAALLYQRGMLALHAAAVAHPGGAILLAGDSGVGKSEMLACLVATGWSLLADDLAPVDLDAQGRPCVWPTWPEMTLWREPGGAGQAYNAPDTTPGQKRDSEIQANSAPVESFSHGYGEADKQRCSVPVTCYETQACPLLGIYWLSLHSQSEIELTTLDGTERFRAVSALAYQSRVAAALLDRVAFFRLASALSRDVPIRRLCRPREGWSAPQLAALIRRAEGA